MLHDEERPEWYQEAGKTEFPAYVNKAKKSTVPASFLTDLGEYMREYKEKSPLKEEPSAHDVLDKMLNIPIENKHLASYAVYYCVIISLIKYLDELNNKHFQRFVDTPDLTQNNNVRTDIIGEADIILLTQTILRKLGVLRTMKQALQKHNNIHWSVFLEIERAVEQYFKDEEPPKLVSSS